MGRILSVDPGEKNIGLAISDPLGITARSLGVIRHVGRDQDVQKIVSIALENDAETILIGQAVGQNGEIGPSARHAQNLADAVRQNFCGEVILWDESGSTNAVQDLYITMNVPKSKRRGHQDARAAAYILQDYLDWLAFQKQYKKEDQQDE